MELKMEENAEFKNNNNLVQYLFKKEDRVHKLIFSLLILSLIAGIETTLFFIFCGSKRDEWIKWHVHFRDRSHEFCH